MKRWRDEGHTDAAGRAKTVLRKWRESSVKRSPAPSPERETDSTFQDTSRGDATAFATGGFQKASSLGARKKTAPSNNSNFTTGGFVSASSLPSANSSAAANQQTFAKPKTSFTSHKPSASVNFVKKLGVSAQTKSSVLHSVIRNSRSQFPTGGNNSNRSAVSSKQSSGNGLGFKPASTFYSNLKPGIQFHKENVPPSASTFGKPKVPGAGASCVGPRAAPRNSFGANRISFAVGTSTRQSGSGTKDNRPSFSNAQRSNRIRRHRRRRRQVQSYVIVKNQP